MMSKHSIVILFVFVLASSVAGQKPYSESKGYTPRKSAGLKDRKKKPEDKIPASTSATVSRDVTVTIPFTVMDRSGAAIGGLTKDDVTVFVDDVETAILTFEQATQPPTLILVIDSSPSTNLRFEKLQSQASNLVASLPSSMKVAVLDFSDNLNVRSQPTTNRAETLSAIAKIKTGVGTSIYSAIQFLYQELMPQVSDQKVIVLMTDGVDTTSKKSTSTRSLT